MLSLFGITATRAEVLALFRRHRCYGATMPFATLSRLALADPSRQLAAGVPNRKGAFAPGDVAAGRSGCKITYPPCKTPVFTPSGFEEDGAGEEVIARSSEVPASRLELQFAYGYDGMNNTSANVFYNCQRQVRCKHCSFQLSPYLKKTERFCICSSNFVSSTILTMPYRVPQTKYPIMFVRCANAGGVLHCGHSSRLHAAQRHP